VAAAERRREVDLLLEHARGWAAGRADVAAVALVGSWARGEEEAGSDVDLVVLTDAPAVYTEGKDWVDDLVSGAALIQTRDWVAIVERRLRLPSGLEVEVGIGRPAWARTPVDPGTLRVVRDGFRAVYDPRGLLAALQAAVRSSECR
jgi:predicted nucleotidyltransferase